MRPANQTKKRTVATNSVIDNATCQNGGLNGNRAGMTIGENNGKMLDQTAKLLSGARIAAIII